MKRQMQLIIVTLLIAVWNGRDLLRQRAASGVYFINLHAGKQLYREKLTLVH